MNLMPDNVYNEAILNCPVSGQSAVFTEARKCLQNHSVGRRDSSGRFASDPASLCYRSGTPVERVAVVTPTRLARLTALRAAITAANLRTITPDCCGGRPMDERQRIYDGNRCEMIEFQCAACSNGVFVDLPLGLAHAHSVGGGAR